MADEEPTSSPETESQVSARESNNIGSQESSFVFSVLLLLHGDKNVCGVFRNIILFSSHDRQLRGMPEVCIILGVSGHY